jgi:hypothetical protein
LRVAFSVKLCAIARNEGPYVADWVFHHLHFGFDAIEIWVNGTEDATGRIVKTLSSTHPEVTKRNADRLLAECLSEGRHFQVAAYQRMARRARREGFSHVAFLDLDEYWTPLDFRSPIQSFLPDDAAGISVVSFPWALDVPDQDREVFEPPFEKTTAVQLHHHVKSVGRLDAHLGKPLVHTFKTRTGGRLWVRSPFPPSWMRGLRRTAAASRRPTGRRTGTSCPRPSSSTPSTGPRPSTWRASRRDSSSRVRTWSSRRTARASCRPRRR